MSTSNAYLIFAHNKNAIVTMVISTAIAITLSTIYANVLLLSYYELTIIPYYFIAQAGMIGLISYLMHNALAVDAKGVAAQLCGLSVGVIGVGILAMTGDHLYTPFILAAYLGFLNAFLGLLAWQVVSSNCDLLLYRGALALTTQYSILSAFGVGLLVAVLMPLAPIWVLPMGLILTLIVLLFANLNIKNLLLKPLDRAWKVSTMSYALYKQLFLYVFLMFIAQVLIDFNLKQELISNSDNQIAQYLGYGIAFANLLGILVFKLYSEQVIKQQGVVGLLAIFPVTLLFLSLAYLIFPTLWTVVLMVVAHYTFTYSCTLLGRKLMLHILPNAIRFKGKLQIRSIASPVAMVIGALIITYLQSTHSAGENVSTASWLIGLSFALLLCLRNLSKIYAETLQQGISLKRLNFAEELNEEDEKTAYQLAIKEIESDDEHNVMSGINLLFKINPKVIPEALFRLLKTSNEMIKLRIIELFGKSPDTKGILLMTHQIALESDPKVLWYLYSGILQFDRKQALLIARKNWDKSMSPASAGIIKIFLEAGNMDEIIESANALNQMLTAKEDNLRLAAARIMGSLKVGSPEKELKKLIQDEVYEVANQAMQAAAECHFEGLIPVIVGRLNHPILGYAAHVALLKFGNEVIPYVRTKLRFCTAPEARTLVKLIASIPSEHAERALMGLAEEKNIYIRSLAVKEYLYRIKNIPMMDGFERFAHRMAYVEVDRIKAYLRLLHYSESNQNLSIAEVKTEIWVRVRMAKIRLLQWIAMFTHPDELGPHVKDLVDIEEDKHKKALKKKYQSILASELKDIPLKKEVFKLLEGGYKPKKNDTDILQDSWITSLLQSDFSLKDDKYMELLDKVFLLRKTEVFKDLPSEVLLAVAKAIKEKDFLKDEVIFRQNDPADGLYIIVSGTIKILAGDKVLKYHQPKEVFGEVGLIDGTRRSADAIGESDGVMLFIDELTFESITNDFPEILRKFTRIIIGHLHKMLETEPKG